MDEPINHGVSGRYVCDASGVMKPADEAAMPDESKPAAKAPTTTKEKV